jgi:hypothetical protein
MQKGIEIYAGILYVKEDDVEMPELFFEAA